MIKEYVPKESYDEVFKQRNKYLKLNLKLKKELQGMLEDIKLARNCLYSMNKFCDNKGCINIACSLNKVYDKEIFRKGK